MQSLQRRALKRAGQRLHPDSDSSREYLVFLRLQKITVFQPQLKNDGQGLVIRVWFGCPWRRRLNLHSLRDSPSFCMVVASLSIIPTILFACGHSERKKREKEMKEMKKREKEMKKMKKKKKKKSRADESDYGAGSGAVTVAAAQMRLTLGRRLCDGD
ncbi:unnamed protein product [Spirodela intermedia]|uniref:Uncharacterized protein n=1 Tax=Spirodela intermedia TaxID=51605 RepID=A0ABN7E8K3_SPIIN|nr:unnamed protein product [Spirodela intermedia]